jgi:tetratricopeptide (TPR) repeat protein
MERPLRRIRPALLEFDPEREVSSETWAILRQALSPQARERYRTAAELREALAQRGPALGANVARVLALPPPDRKVAPSPGPEPQAVVSVWDPQRMLTAHLEMAREAQARGDWDTVIQQAEKARQLDPNNREAAALSQEAAAQRKQQQVQHHLDLARRAERQRDWDTVREHAERVLELEPDNDAARRLFDAASARRARGPRLGRWVTTGVLAVVLVALAGWWIAGRVRWERMSDPEKALALLNRGRNAFEDSRFGKAARLLEQAAELKPNDYQIHHWLGKTYYFQNRRGKALQEFQQELGLNPPPGDDARYAKKKVEELTRDGR